MYNQSLSNYTNLGYTIDAEQYNVTNDSIVFNPLYDPFNLTVKYYGKLIYTKSAQSNETINVPSVVKFSFTKCLNELLTITLGNDTTTKNCSEDLEVIMLAPTTNATALIQSDKRDNISLNITQVNKFENVQPVSFGFKATNVTITLNTTLSASDFIVTLNTYKMNLTNNTFFIQQTENQSFAELMYVMITYKNHSIKQIVEAVNITLA